MCLTYWKCNSVVPQNIILFFQKHKYAYFSEDTKRRILSHGLKTVCYGLKVCPPRIHVLRL